MKLLSGFFKTRLQNWIDKRLKLQEGDISVEMRTIYIVPTYFGFAFMAVLIAMLIGSINYEISLGYMLTFLLGSIMLIGMLLTHQNFGRVKIRPSTPQAVFAKQNSKLALLANNEKPAFNIGLSISGSTQHFNFIANQTEQFNLATTHRGKHTINKIKLHSIYPFGLFYTWSWVKTDISYYVYPEPKQHLSKQPDNSDITNTGDNSSSKKGNDELVSYTPFKDGDPVNRIAWKKTAQTGKLHSKDMSALLNEDVYVDWHQLPTLETEARLSQMCQDIINLHAKQVNYGLKLPNTTIKANHSESHKHECLKALASFGYDE